MTLYGAYHRKVGILSQMYLLTLNHYEILLPYGNNIHEFKKKHRFICFIFLLQQGGAASPVLLETTIYTVNNEICAARYMTLPTPAVVTENMICAGLLDVGGRDACQGDSGGPLYYQYDQDGSRVSLIVGVVSWGHGCANETFPGVSTAVSPYTDWITSTIENMP